MKVVGVVGVQLARCRCGNCTGLISNEREQAAKRKVERKDVLSGAKYKTVLSQVGGNDDTSFWHISRMVS